MIFLQLYWEFFKIGLFSIGGGLATLPFLYTLAQTHPQWLTAKSIADMIAISESTPGPIGINMATFAGYQAAGIVGGVVATLGEITPSVIIIIFIARFLGQFDKNRYVKDAFYALRPAVVGLITFAGLRLFSVTLFPEGMVRIQETILYAILVFFVLRFKKVHPLIWIVLGAIAGIVIAFLS
ncbi:chromate transporter [Sphaerochaeta globosa]|uniref:Chromate transporter n=1 Tax=Sphaerochaeta globosa (strain ATCC BAA-1886 / DSM 22777 / Buddy) TaxID=158189 RepID=F0RW12_SPHGB|nr:chromate transporter [Sphaerochaeta globosa]ADY13298.1 Chromate transporter [Sphaerochaeta globosa str. Buddy]